MEKTKNKTCRAIPLTGLALDLLRKHAGGGGLKLHLVFPGKIPGKPIAIRRPWLTAVKKEGIENFRFHDLRHSAASYTAMSGSSLVEIGILLGHKRLEVTKRYSHLSQGHIINTDKTRTAVLKFSPSESYNDKVLFILNSFHQFLVKGKSFKKNRKKVYLANEKTLKDAIKQFLALEQTRHLREKYSEILEQFIEVKILDPSMSLEVYRKMYNEIEKEIRSYCDPFLEGKQKYIVFQWLNTFIFHGASIPPKVKKRNTDSQKIDMSRFFEFLLKERTVYALIARLLWYLNYEIYEGVGERGPIIPLETVLRLTVENLSEDDHTISLYMPDLYNPSYFCTFVPDEIFYSLLELSKQTDVFIFRNRLGAPIDSSQIRRAFRKASKACGIEAVTPSHLC